LNFYICRTRNERGAYKKKMSNSKSSLRGAEDAKEEHRSSGASVPASIPRSSQRCTSFYLLLHIFKIVYCYKILMTSYLSLRYIENQNSQSLSFFTVQIYYSYCAPISKITTCLTFQTLLNTKCRKNL